MTDFGDVATSAVLEEVIWKDYKLQMEVVAITSFVELDGLILARVELVSSEVELVLAVLELVLTWIKLVSTI